MFLVKPTTHPRRSSGRPSTAVWRQGRPNRAGDGSARRARPGLYSTATAGSGVGYCGTQVFQASDWVPEARKAIQACETIVDSLRSSTVTPVQVIQHFDKISDLICTVSDPAELCANTHTQGKFAEGASQAVAVLGSYINKLNASGHLYERILYALNKAHELTEEQFVVGNQFRIEFEHHGVHLPKTKNKELFQLQEEILDLTRTFYSMIAKDSTNRQMEAPKSVLQYFTKAEAKEFDTIGDKILLPPSQHIYNVVMSNVEDEGLRKSMYKLAHDLPEELEVLEGILHRRQRLADLLGFASFSHMSAWHRSLKTPQSIFDLLDEVTTKSQTKASQELHLLSQQKKLLDPTSDGRVHNWDVDYLKSHYLASNRVQSSKGYLSVENCFEGMTLVAKHLFDINFKRVPADPHEIWSPPSVFKLEVTNANNEVLGYVYCDLYQRPGKFQGAANFPIRFTSMHNRIARIALVCSFDPPSRDQPTELSFTEMETLFHEFGHTLQSLLSATQLFHFAGTRSFVDFVETCSLLFEHFASNHRVLRLWAKNKNGEAIPESVVQSHLFRRQCFGGVDLQTQVLISAVDQTLHSGPAVLQGDTVSMIQALTSKYSLFPHVPGAAWHAKMGHLVGYGAGYYSYILSGINSSSIWHKLFAADPLSRQAGEKLQNDLLVYAGARNPSKLMEDLLDGEKPSINAWLEDKVGK